MKCVGIQDLFGTSGEYLVTLVQYFGLATQVVAQTVNDVVCPQGAVSVGK